MAKTYRLYNFASPTTASPVLVTTGTAIKTMLQIATPSTEDIAIVEWGIMFDAATVARCELIDTGVAATVTAAVAGDIVKMNRPNDAASVMTLGTTATGYTASAEGTVAASRLLDFQTIAAVGGPNFHQYPLGREPVVPVSRFLRVRLTSTVAVGCACYVEWEE